MTSGSPAKFRRAVRKYLRRTARKTLPVVRGRYPYRYEVRLRGLLSRMYGNVGRAFRAWFISKVPYWERTKGRYTGDSWDTEAGMFLEQFAGELDVLLYDRGALGLDARAFMDKLASLVLAFVTEEVARELDVLVGEAFYGGTLWWEAVKSQWLSELTSRIKGSASDFVERLYNDIYEAARADLPFSEILTLIQKRTKGLTEARARFLAEDTLGTLVSVITKNLHQSIGIEYYLWQTQADEAVRGRPGGKYPNARPSHWEMEGVVCAWGDPTVMSLDAGVTWVSRTPTMEHLHPGEARRCRCIAVPFLGPIITEESARVGEGV